MSRRQYVVQSHPAFDALVHDNLCAAGWETQLFVTREEFRIRGGRRVVTAPLFPSYLFVSFDVADVRWRTIAAVRGVKRILGADPLKPTALPCGALDELKARYAAGEFVKKKTARIAAGDPAVVRSGPFQGHVGVCTESRGERITVLLRLLGGEMPVRLPAHIVERAPVANNLDSPQYLGA